MKNKNQKLFCISALFLFAFLLWTLLLLWVDAAKVGPLDTRVGFSTLNLWANRLIGVNMALYALTDIMMLLPILFAIGFAALGLYQLIRRKSLFKVDSDILALGGFYIAVILCFILFEIAAINYRPVLIDGALEVSYPSSTTLVFMTVMPGAALQMKKRIKGRAIKAIAVSLTAAITAFTVVARILSGVHWISDIIGGILLSCGLVFLYAAVCGALASRTSKRP